MIFVDSKLKMHLGVKLHIYFLIAIICFYIKNSNGQIEKKDTNIYNFIFKGRIGDCVNFFSPPNINQYLSTVSNDKIKVNSQLLLFPDINVGEKERLMKYFHNWIIMGWKMEFNTSRFNHSELAVDQLGLLLNGNLIRKWEYYTGKEVVDSKELASLTKNEVIYKSNLLNNIYKYSCHKFNKNYYFVSNSTSKLVKLEGITGTESVIDVGKYIDKKYELIYKKHYKNDTHLVNSALAFRNELRKGSSFYADADEFIPQDIVASDTNIFIVGNMQIVILLGDSNYQIRSSNLVLNLKSDTCMWYYHNASNDTDFYNYGSYPIRSMQHSNEFESYCINKSIVSNSKSAIFRGEYEFKENSINFIKPIKDLIPSGLFYEYDAENTYMGVFEVDSVMKMYSIFPYLFTGDSAKRLPCLTCVELGKIQIPRGILANLPQLHQQSDMFFVLGYVRLGNRHMILTIQNAEYYLLRTTDWTNFDTTMIKVRVESNQFVAWENENMIFYNSKPSQGELISIQQKNIWK